MDRRSHFDMKMDLKTLVEIVTLLGAIFAGWLSFQSKLDMMSEQIERTSQQTERIEHYLSQSDKDYWKKITENGDFRR
ncbi:MAG TPA: hypothetical protein VJY15_19915 [Candidatus Acidoferrum sp.]|nr:hypothetical protein [Candidatus Acidoferrum sp.]